jgi:uncharacterized protein YdaU (DUF1376 family)
VNYYPFHIGDYLSATRHLSWEEDAAFRRLLDTYYTTEKPLPLEPRAVCRLVLATTDSQREAVRVVLEEFFDRTAEGWVNRRADAEIEAMREKQAKQRAKANKRWAKPETEPGIAPAMPRHDETDAAASKTDADAMPPTPTPTPTEKHRVASQPRVAIVDLPDWLPAQAWQDWHDYRNSRKGWTAKARNLSLASLTKLRAKGHDPTAVIEQSIERGWTGLFPVNGDPDANRTRSSPAGRKLSAVEQVELAIRERREREDAGTALVAIGGG